MGASADRICQICSRILAMGMAEHGVLTGDPEMSELCARLAREGLLVPIAPERSAVLDFLQVALPEVEIRFWRTTLAGARAIGVTVQ
jgi:hypothetical protein